LGGKKSLFDGVPSQNAAKNGAPFEEVFNARDDRGGSVDSTEESSGLSFSQKEKAPNPCKDSITGETSISGVVGIRLSQGRELRVEVTLPLRQRGKGRGRGPVYKHSLKNIPLKGVRVGAFFA
jgi:hypothetical protein